MTEQKLTRRRLLAITGAGAATAAGVATLGIVPSASADEGAIDSDSRRVVDAVLAAFRRHRIVAIGEIHGQQEHHDALQTLLLDPRLPAVVNDIVVENVPRRWKPSPSRSTKPAGSLCRSPGEYQRPDRQLRLLGPVPAGQRGEPGHPAARRDPR